MSLTSLTVQNLRTHELFSITLDPGATLIIGKNGSGKTSLLEAIYFTHQGTSFRGRDREMIAHGKQSSEIKAEFSDGQIRRGKLSHTDDGKITKQFQVQDKTTSRLSSTHRQPVVLFDPEELRALSSSPTRRRDFFDGIIARLSPTYQTVLNRFTRTLAQRNELLKQYESMNHSAWESHMFAWDIKFVELAATIIKARANFITKSNQRISSIYSELAEASHTIKAAYSVEFESIEACRQSLLHHLEASHQADALRGFTSTGPHRDDILISLDGHPATETASRGEMRTIMLAYKLLELELQEEITGKPPLVLMDDVFSELDTTREKKLINTLGTHQTIITATDLRNQSDYSSYHVIKLD
ncbi:MAG TPA: DNA replication and repair protein RecF [Candidatus Saccharimonadales bacterium]